MDKFKYFAEVDAMMKFIDNINTASPIIIPLILRFPS